MSIRSGPGRTVLLAMILSLSLVLTASAACPGTRLEVLPSSVTIDNAGSGALTPGMGVVMSVRVDFPDKENTTYPETSQLELTSGLENPYWTWNIVRNGVKKDETEERKSRVIINGDVLAWPANTTESLEIHLYGTAPPSWSQNALRSFASWTLPEPPAMIPYTSIVPGCSIPPSPARGSAACTLNSPGSGQMQQ
jgi:hypothetical protein